MKKVFIISALSGIVMFFLMIGLAVLLIAGVEDEDASNSGSTSLGNIGLASEVLAHKPMVEKYCEEYGISEYVIYILAIMQVESGGRAVDVMQCSESLGLPPNTLGTDASIRQGCKYFSELLRSADGLGCDLNTVIQSYNYGGGFISYAAKNGGSYTFDLAVSFSRMMANGRTIVYNNSIAVSANGGWRYHYGNMFYVSLVMQYIGTVSTSDSGFIWPSDSGFVVTSVFGNRIHPISGSNRHHNGIDIGASFGTNVLATAGGKVTLSQYYGGYGNCIIIDHGNGYTTLYGHMSRLLVTVGTTVTQGQVIGLVGSTGNSTGPHIHWEVTYNGERTDPLDFIPENVYTYK